MIEKVIKALKDFELKTCFGFHLLSEGEVKRIRFKNQKSFATLLTLGVFIEAKRDEKESKNIPVILPEPNEDTIVEVEPIEKIDPPGGIDPDKPDLPCPKEKVMPEVSSDEAGEPTAEETLEDRRRSEPPIEELTVKESTPEQETQGQEVVKVEIPNEAPRLKSKLGIELVDDASGMVSLSKQ